MRGAIPPNPNTPSWHDAQLKITHLHKTDADFVSFLCVHFGEHLTNLLATLSTTSMLLPSILTPNPEFITERNLFSPYVKRLENGEVMISTRALTDVQLTSHIDRGS